MLCMKLAAYLKGANERPSAFARRIGVSHSTLSGWLHDPSRGPGRSNLIAIERATGGKVTAQDFATGEDTPESVGEGNNLAAPQPAVA